METSTQLLDQQLIDESKSFNASENLASPGKRIANYFIDLVVVLVLFFIVTILLLAFEIIREEGSALDYLTYPFMFVYYTLFEAASGKTIGKLITGCKVVDMEGNEITFGQSAGRSICRFIPFEAFTFLGSSGRGLHDKLPKTIVINSR